MKQTRIKTPKQTNPLLENRDPKRTKRIILGGIVVFWLTFSLLMLSRFPLFKTHVDIYFAVQNLSPNSTIALNELVPFQWDEVYTFPPASDKNTMAQAMSLDSTSDLKTTSPNQVQYYFLHQGKIVCAVYGTPDSVGFILDMETSPWYFADDIQLQVEKEDYFLLSPLP